MCSSACHLHDGPFCEGFGSWKHQQCIPGPARPRHTVLRQCLGTVCWWKWTTSQRKWKNMWAKLYDYTINTAFLTLAGCRNMTESVICYVWSLFVHLSVWSTLTVSNVRFSATCRAQEPACVWRHHKHAQYRLGSRWRTCNAVQNYICPTKWRPHYRVCKYCLLLSYYMRNL